MRTPLLALPLLVGCLNEDEPQRADAWFDQGSPYQVEEALTFTDVPYDFTGPTPLGEVPRAPEFSTIFAADSLAIRCDSWEESGDLPVEIEGIVTVHPRYYIKTGGCVAPGDREADADEKYYGSFFIEDASGGWFVLGNSKVAHFDAGARVALRLNATKEAFGLNMVANWTLLAVDHGPHPIYYQPLTEPFTTDHIGRTYRVEGVVTRAADTFGSFEVLGDNGTAWDIRLDAELNRRGVGWPEGTRLQVTGPVIESFGLGLVVMRIGQVEVLP